MPRMQVVTNLKFDPDDYKNDDPRNDPVDMCRSCWKTITPEKLAEHCGTSVEMVKRYNFNGDEKIKDDVPDTYDLMGYDCNICGRKLTSRDD